MRHRTLVAGAAVVVVAVGTTAIVLGHHDGPNGAASTPATTSAPAEPSSGSPMSACGLTGTPGPGADGATSATWEAAGAYSLPVSATDGPGVRVPAGPWSCFTHTPSGAVLAGITIALRVNGVAENWQDVARQQTMPGPGQDALLSKPLPDAEVVTVRGYTVAGYSSARATIRYYLHTPTTDASCTADVRWSTSDWRLVLSDTGSTTSGCTAGAPTGFTPWGPT